MFAFIRTRRLKKTVHVAQSLATGCILTRESIEFAKKSRTLEVDFELKSGKTSFLEF